MLQPEISEIIVVDDGSGDATPQIVRSLIKKDHRISLLHHSGFENKGRSASRNLGIFTATSEWITFLDADDYLVQGRFKKFNKLVNSGIDGFYEPVLSQIESSELTALINALTTIDPPGSIDNLQDYLIRHREERISIIGTIVRRKLVMENGLFDENLSIGEDTDFLWRIVGHGNWQMISRTEPKVIRRVHRDNTYSKGSRIRDKDQFYSLWYNRLSKLDISEEARKRITTSFHYYRYRKQADGANIFQKAFLFISYKLSELFRK